jgi:hypothetical protein
MRPLVDYISYGMYIKLDSGFTNGISGTDYEVIVKWNNYTQTWNRIFEERIPSGESRVIDEEDNYTGFSEDKEGYGYVSLYADLAKMDFPQNYYFTFYTIYTKGNSSFTDVTNAVHIPFPEFSTSLFPNPVDLRPGDRKTISIQVNSSTDLEPLIQLYTTNKTSDIQWSFDKDQLHLPSYGIDTTSLRLSYSGNKTDGSIVLPVFEKIVIPIDIAFPQYASINKINPSNNYKARFITTYQQLNLIIDFLPPLSFREQLNDFITGWFSPITTVITSTSTIASGVLGYFFARSRKKGKVKTDNF